MITTAQINKILEIKDAWEAPQKLMTLIFNKEKRIESMKYFLEIEKDISYDWFRNYFEEEQAERKKLKQDFTPQCVCDLLCKIAGNASTNYEICAGTGGIIVTKWWQDCLKENPLEYLPSEHIYFCEELSDRSVPFLLFDLAIRGMNAIVIHGDALSRNCKGIFYVHNEKDDFLAFSNINLMPYSEEIEKYFKVKFTEQKYPPLVEDENPFLGVE